MLLHLGAHLDSGCQQGCQPCTLSVCQGTQKGAKTLWRLWQQIVELCQTLQPDFCMGINLHNTNIAVTQGKDLSNCALRSEGHLTKLCKVSESQLHHLNPTQLLAEAGPSRTDS